MLYITPGKAGPMADRVASPNDPVFIVHLTMIDCIFDEWLKRHPDEEYPEVPMTFSIRGHQAHNYMIPFSHSTLMLKCSSRLGTLDIIMIYLT